MKPKYIVIAILIALSIGALISIASDMSAYASFAMAENNQDQRFQVVGYLSKDKEMKYDPEVDPNYFSFYMKDKKDLERKVILLDAKPQDFERSEEIVVTGQMKGQEFHASKMLMKCPSKYTEEEVQLKEITYQ